MRWDSEEEYSEEEYYGRRWGGYDCGHDDEFYDDRPEFEKLSEFIYQTLPDGMPTDQSSQQEQQRIPRSDPTKLLDSYISDSDDSYTEEELLEYAKRGKYFKKDLMQKAKQGDANAYYKIAKKYRDISLHKSLLWYERAAEKNHVEAQVALGDIYLSNANTPPPNYSLRYTTKHDWKKALRWYHEAFKNGSKEAAFKVATVYEKYATTEANHFQSALEWYIKAYETGCAKAGEYVGHLYERGNGAEQNYDIAKGWYLRSYENGHILSGVKLAGLYFNEDWEEYDGNIAEEWCQKAYAEGDGNVAYQISLLYLNNGQSDEDGCIKTKWIYKAALAGHVKARNRILGNNDSLNADGKKKVIYEHYTRKLKYDLEKQAKQVTRLEEQLKAKDDTIAALEKRLKDAGL